VTPERINNLRSYIAEARRKGARDETHAYMAPVTLAELESLIEAVALQCDGHSPYCLTVRPKGENHV
jgi:hypothetical protein